MGLLQKAKEKALEFTEGELATAGVAKVHEMLGMFNAALPLLEEAGCRPCGAEVEITLPPKLVAYFATSDVSEEAIARITAAHPDKTLACAILKTLAHGARLQRAMNVSRLPASTLAVEIGLPPCLKLSFGNT